MNAVEDRRGVSPLTVGALDEALYLTRPAKQIRLSLNRARRAWSGTVLGSPIIRRVTGRWPDHCSIALETSRSRLDWTSAAREDGAIMDLKRSGAW